MRRLRSTPFTATFAVSTLLAAGCVAAEASCLYSVSGTEEPYLVLGSRVVPQANYLVVDDCGKTVDDVRTGLSEEAEKVQAGHQDTIAMVMAMRVEGDRLIRARDHQKVVDAQQSTPLQGWWSWVMTWSPF